MKDHISPQRLAILRFYKLAHATQKHPLMADVSARFQCSPQAVYAHLHALQQQGYLKHHPPTWTPTKKKEPVAW